MVDIKNALEIIKMVNFMALNMNGIPYKMVDIKNALELIKMVSFMEFTIDLKK
jgi:hypothetical protein